MDLKEIIEEGLACYQDNTFFHFITIDEILPEHRAILLKAKIYSFRARCKCKTQKGKIHYHYLLRTDTPNKNTSLKKKMNRYFAAEAKKMPRGYLYTVQDKNHLMNLIIYICSKGKTCRHEDHSIKHPLNNQKNNSSMAKQIRLAFYEKYPDMHMSQLKYEIKTHKN